MNTSNLDDCTDSEILNTGFADFVRNQQQQCMDTDCVELEGPQSSGMSSPAGLSIRSSSLKSVAPPAVSNTERAVDDVGFNRFLDEWASRWSQQAKYQWNKMSKRDRAKYALKDDIVSCSSSTSGSTVSTAVKRFINGEVSNGAIKRACDRVCANLVKRRTCKPKCPKAKRGPKPKNARKVPKSCPKPRSEKCPTSAKPNPTVPNC